MMTDQDSYRKAIQPFAFNRTVLTQAILGLSIGTIIPTVWADTDMVQTLPVIVVDAKRMILMQADKSHLKVHWAFLATSR